MLILFCPTNHIIAHFHWNKTAWYSTDCVDNCAPLNSVNSAIWSGYNSFNSFNGCHEFLIISDPFWPLFIVHSRSTSCCFLEHSLTLTIINQAIFHQTTVVIRIQTQIQKQAIQIQNQIQTDWNMGLLIKSIALHSYKTRCQLSNVSNISNLHVYHSGRMIVLHNMYHTGQVLSLKDNDFSSFFLDLHLQNWSKRRRENVKSLYTFFLQGNPTNKNLRAVCSCTNMTISAHVISLHYNSKFTDNLTDNCLHCYFFVCAQI